MNDSFLNRKFKYTYCNAAQLILGVNVLVFVLTNFLDIRIKGLSLTYWLSLIPVFINHGYVWQFVTHMFVHADMTHILFNMYALMMFGMGLERAIGSREFLTFYFVTGIVGGIICYAINVFTGMEFTATMGASGAIYALMFLVSVLFPENRVLLFFFIPMKMPLAVIIFMALEISSQVLGTSAGIAHLSHLSSISVAWVYCVVRFRISPLKVWKIALRR